MKKFTIPCFMVILLSFIVLPCFATQYEVLYMKDKAKFGCLKIIKVRTYGADGRGEWGSEERGNKDVFGLVVVDWDKSVVDEINKNQYIWYVKGTSPNITAEKFVDEENTYGVGKTDKDGKFVKENINAEELGR